MRWTLFVLGVHRGRRPRRTGRVSALMHPPKQAPSPMLYAGFALAAIGAGLVLRYRPA